MTRSADYNDVVAEFCHSWTKQDYDRMFKVISRSGIGKLGNKRFKKKFSILGEGLLAYKLISSFQRDQSVIVKANLRFNKDLPPSMISGVHTFRLIKEQGEWRIEHIIPPFVPSSPDAVHPTKGEPQPGI